MKIKLYFYRVARLEYFLIFQEYMRKYMEIKDPLLLEEWPLSGGLNNLKSLKSIYFDY